MRDTGQWKCRKLYLVGKRLILGDEETSIEFKMCFNKIVPPIFSSSASEKSVSVG